MAKLEGHAEEILSVQGVWFEGKFYLVSSSQDGYLIKWKIDLSKIGKEPVEFTKMADGLTCMAFNVAFLPNTGNKYFVAGCDEEVRLYDFDKESVSRQKTRREFIKLLFLFFA